jgi:leucyl aminopeptidase
MAVTFDLRRDLPADVDAVVLPACSDQLGGGDTDWAYLRARGFEGKADQMATVPGPDGRVIMLIGLGPSAEVDPGVLRRASAVAGRAASRHRRVATFLLDVVPDPGQRPGAAQALAEGWLAGTYRYLRFKKPDPSPTTAEVVVVGTGGKRVAAGLAVGARIGEAVALARDLVNEPGGSLTPATFAQIAVEIAEREDLQVTVWEHGDIVAAGLGGVLGVNRGSQHPARFVQLCFEPERPRGTLALVGKGITFDAGGLSIKSAAGMMTMKDDMAGAAAVLAAFSALRVVKPKCRVLGYLPLTDNMLGGDATRPGDVLAIRGGTTVEVLNTDAEGRLVLADALALASEDRPDAIVDIATLTGAVETALGNRLSGLMGNHEGWIDQVQAAASATGERVWPLPLPDDYRKRLDSDVADIRNVARAPGAGSLLAGLFLRDFVGDGIAWAHLDIAGTAWSNEVDGELGKGGTGAGVRLLLELIRSFTRPR